MDKKLSYAWDVWMRQSIGVASYKSYSVGMDFSPSKTMVPVMYRTSLKEKFGIIKYFGLIRAIKLYFIERKLIVTF